jgi:hemoglobin-like flavoprotein
MTEERVTVFHPREMVVLLKHVFHHWLSLREEEFQMIVGVVEEAVEEAMAEVLGEVVEDEVEEIWAFLNNHTK